MSKGYVFQPSFFELLETFSKPSERDALNMAIHRFMFRGEEPTFTNMELKRAWIGLYPYLSKSRKTSLTMSRDTLNNLPRNFEDTSKILARNSEDTSKKLLSRDKDKDKGEEKKDKEKSATASSPSRFHKPTVDEVRAYIQESGYHVNPNDFVNFYESKGWLVGKSPMKDWKAAVRTWESKEKNENPAKFAEEKEEEYHPIVPLDRCHVCDSKNVSTQGLFSQCNACGVTYVWNSKKGEWREEC